MERLLGTDFFVEGDRLKLNIARHGKHYGLDENSVLKCVGFDDNPYYAGHLVIKHLAEDRIVSLGRWCPQWFILAETDEPFPGECDAPSHFGRIKQNDPL
jgi:hypothetical protein